MMISYEKKCQFYNRLNGFMEEVSIITYQEVSKIDFIPVTNQVRIWTNDGISGEIFDDIYNVKIIGSSMEFEEPLTPWGSGGDSD